MTIPLLFLSLLFAQQPERSGFGTMSGQVRNSDGSPAVEVRIALTPAEADASGALSNIVQTDKDGRYRLEEVLPGRYLIVAGPLASPTYFPGVAPRNQGQVVTISAGQAVANADFKLASPQATTAPSGNTGNVVNAIVRFSDGNLFPGGEGSQSRTWMELVINGNTRTIAINRTGKTGFFGLENLPPGANTIAAGKAPISYYVQSMTFGNVDLTKAPLMVVPAALSNEHVEIVLTTRAPAGSPPAFQISGRITNADFPESSDIKLLLTEVLPNGSRVMRGQFSNSLAVSADRKNGVFEIDGVPPGRYKLQVDRQGLGQNQPERFVRVGPGLNVEIISGDVTNLELSLNLRSASPETPVP